MEIITYTDKFLIELLEFIKWAQWLFIAAFFLVIADLKFGIDASRYRKELIKRSRALRRTFSKLTDYIIWVILSYCFGKAIGGPFDLDILPILMLAIIYFAEIESIYVNYFTSKGKKVKVKFFKIFGRKTDLIEFEDETDTK